MKSERATARLTKPQRNALEQIASATGLDFSDILRLCLDGFIPELMRRFKIKGAK
jgi:hypothetical protein